MALPGLYSCFSLSDAYQQCLDLCRVEGRTPDLQEWQRLIANIEELNENLGRLEFDWTEEDEMPR